jgi:hypothetical protein
MTSVDKDNPKPAQAEALLEMQNRILALQEEIVPEGQSWEDTEKLATAKAQYLAT